MKHRFSEKFEQQLLRAIAGHSPWKQHVEKVYKPIPPSDKQIKFLRSLGYTGDVPASLGEASSLIGKLLQK